MREKCGTSQCNPKLRYNVSQKQKYVFLKTRTKGNSSKAGTQRHSEPMISQISFACLIDLAREYFPQGTTSCNNRNKGLLISRIVVFFFIVPVTKVNSALKTLN